MADDIPAISGLTSATAARVVLKQSGQLVHAPATAIGLISSITGTANKITATTTGTATTLTIPNAVTLVTPTVTGTLTAQALVDISGASAGQITFPASQNASANANTLDDYAENTWTPTITAVSGTFTTVSGTGVYTKIGRLTVYNVSITVTTVGTAGGGVRFTLPFAPSATTGLTLYGRETAITGKSLNGVFFSGSTMTVFYYDNTFPGASGTNLIIGGHFFA